MSQFDRIIDRSGTAAVKVDARKGTFGNENVIPMWVADMDVATAPAITEALMARASHGIYGYTMTTDDDYNAIINWLKDRYGADIKREWIMWSPGVINSMRMVINALTRPGDKIVVQPPVYPPFFSTVTDSGRYLRYNNLINDNGYYTMDYDDLETAFRGGATMLMICSPHNPVGRVWTREELQRVVDLCRKYDVLLVADEIHAGFIHTGHTHHTLPTFDYENSIMFMSASKSFNLAGMGISNLIVRKKEYRDRINKFNASAGVSTGEGHIFAMTAQRAAYTQGGEWLTELTRYIEGNMDATLERIAAKMPLIKCRKPEGTYLMWMDMGALGTGKEVFDALCKAGVGLNGGGGFGVGDMSESCMRFNVACPRSQVEAALDCMEKAYAALTAK